jgi:hypothetical protein
MIGELKFFIVSLKTAAYRVACKIFSTVYVLYSANSIFFSTTCLPGNYLIIMPVHLKSIEIGLIKMPCCLNG